MSSTTDSITTRDGIRLLTRRWSAPRPRAGVVIVHGLGEHSGRYEHVGEQLAAAGLEAFSWDLRCFGASDGQRGWLDDWSQLHDDVEAQLALVRAALPGLPTILYGHSLGGLVALGYCLEPRPRPDLLVLSAPGIADALAAWKHVVAPIAARVAPRLEFPIGITPAMRCRDPARQEAVRADPLMHGSSTAKLGAMGFAEQARVRAAADRLGVPTLVIHGNDDPIVPVRATESLAAIPGVTRRTYAGIRHELHNEPEGPQILADVIAWIDGQLVARGQGVVAAR